MSDRVPAPQPPIFNLQAYSPAEIKEAVEKVGVKKANLPPLASFMLAIVAGGSVGFGALYYTIVASDADLSFATVRVVGGLVFSLGLALVLVGGAELFTGNNLIVMAWASGKVSTGTMLRNWTIVYLGNLLGSLGLIVLVSGGIFASIKLNERGVVGVQTGKVVRQDLTAVVTASGEVKPKNYINLGANTLGPAPITDILVKEGDRVRKGQVVAKLLSVQPGADVQSQVNRHQSGRRRDAQDDCHGDRLLVRDVSRTRDAADRWRLHLSEDAGAERRSRRSRDTHIGAD